MNYRMEIAYDGSRYQGWQRQKRTDQTIQGKIEEVLSRLAGYPVEIHGAGRTDAGVHARGQTANVHLEGEVSSGEMLSYLNRYLPEDIEVLQVREAPKRFHSRLSAVGKRYIYRIGTDGYKNVFERKYRYRLGKELDQEAMAYAAAALLGTHDFKSFCGNPRMKKSTVRTITRLDIVRVPHEIQLVYEGDGFLQYMIRIITGTLIEVGLGERGADTMSELLEALDRKAAGATAPACGLYLDRIFYPGEL